MAPLPKISTPEEALAYAREKLEVTTVFDDARVLWFVEGRAWWIGVKDGPRRDVYVLGPRGGFTRWLTLDENEARWLREWL